MKSKNKKFRNFNNGFTLVELVVAFTILAFLVVGLLATLNPIVLVNRGNDGLRKKSLNRIKTAFEDYYNDKGHYPDSTMVANLTDSNNCKTAVFAPWLSQWPCDPLGPAFFIDVGPDPLQPKWFKIFTNLQDKKDKEIPLGWYSADQKYHLANYTTDTVNFGVSSSNVLWYDYEYLAVCDYHAEDHSLDNCFHKGEFSCVPSTEGCADDNCYSSNCNSLCKVLCCGSGCDE